MLYMSDLFAIRNVDKKTKAFIADYAHEHAINMNEALREIVFLVQEHLKENKPIVKKRKYSIFEIYDKVAFSSNDPNLSKNIDKYLYGKRD